MKNAQILLILTDAAERIFTCKHWLRYSWEQALQNLGNTCQTFVIQEKAQHGTDRDLRPPCVVITTSFPLLALSASTCGPWAGTKYLRKKPLVTNKANVKLNWIINTVLKLNHTFIQFRKSQETCTTNSAIYLDNSFCFLKTVVKFRQKTSTLKYKMQNLTEQWNI